MRASNLKRLANACELSKLDLQPRHLSLVPTERGTLAWYASQYAGGGVEVEDSGLERPVSVSASEFGELVSLFNDEDDVKLSCAPTMLVLTCGKRRMTLRYQNTPDAALYTELRQADVVGRMNRAAFATEIGFAGQATATTVTMPVLTGIRLVFTEKVMGIQAANGTSLVLETLMPLSDGKKAEIIAPTMDLSVGLKILDGDVVTIARRNRSLVLISDRAAAMVGTLAGTWPKMSALRGLQFGDELVLSPGVLRTLVRAAAALKTTGDVIFAPDTAGDGVLLSTRDSEMGHYQEGITGSVAKPHVLSAADLDVAARMNANDTRLAFSDTLAKVVADNRTLYLTPRVL